jgi:hypothetical protein
MERYKNKREALERAIKKEEKWFDEQQAKQAKK